MESISSDKAGMVLHILDKIESAILLIKERTKEIHSSDDFMMSQDGMLRLDAVCMVLIAIGESVKNLDKITNKELLATDSSIPWKLIMGVRDIIAHHYFDIDAEEIYSIINSDLDPLLASIRRFKLQFLKEV